MFTSDWVPLYSNRILPSRGDLDDSAAGIFWTLAQSQQHVSIGQDPAVARSVRISPGDLARAVADVGLAAGGEKGVGDGNLRVRGSPPAGPSRPGPGFLVARTSN